MNEIQLVTWIAAHLYMAGMGSKITARMRAEEIVAKMKEEKMVVFFERDNVRKDS